MAHEWRWVDIYNGCKLPLCLKSTSNATPRLVEPNAKPFTQPEETCSVNRPELIEMVEERYWRHHPLINSQPPLLASSHSSFSSTKHPLPDSQFSKEESCHSYFKIPESKDSSEEETQYESYSTCSENWNSEDDNLDQEETHFEQETRDEITRLRKEIKRLKEENTIQKKGLMQKDDEKREAIRQLSVTVEVVKEENVKLKKFITAKNRTAKKRSIACMPLLDILKLSYSRGYLHF